MGAEQSFCSEVSIQIMEIPTSLSHGLQINLNLYKSHAPSNIYAKKSHQRPKLSQRVQETINYLLSTQPLKTQIMQGYDFPCFLILKKKVYYFGQWLDGLPHGKGRVYFTNGSFFEGWFNQAQVEGQDNIFIYPDGSFYRGSFKNSKKNGFGRFSYHNGFQYSGVWKDDQPHGSDGIQKYPDGSKYVGTFIRGLKEGKGQYFWPDGKVYYGEFKNGQMSGKGILKKGDQSYFEGQFANNKKQGKGRLKLPFGVYQGAFMNGLMSGQGTFVWTNGRTYKGSFAEGKMHGNGTLTFINGKSIIGIWENGQNIQILSINNLKKNV